MKGLNSQHLLLLEREDPIYTLTWTKKITTSRVSVTLSTEVASKINKDMYVVYKQTFLDFRLEFEGGGLRPQLFSFVPLRTMELQEQWVGNDKYWAQCHQPTCKYKEKKKEKHHIIAKYYS